VSSSRILSGDKLTIPSSKGQVTCGHEKQIQLLFSSLDFCTGSINALQQRDVALDEFDLAIWIQSLEFRLDPVGLFFVATNEVYFGGNCIPHKFSCCGLTDATSPSNYKTQLVSQTNDGVGSELTEYSNKTRTKSFEVCVRRTYNFKGHHNIRLIAVVQR
jgi:hypothetical protein